jgi:methylenetetrahydrofolate reductase (NADPH)
MSRLKMLLDSGHFAVTGECGPPKGPDGSVIRKKAAWLKGALDAVNVTDNQTSIVRMSSVAASKLLIDEGLEPVMQMVCRDRNRIAMQSDIFGDSAFGIQNLLCLSGDHQTFGNQTGAKNVYDVDSIQLLQICRTLRDDNTVMGGDPVEGNVDLFLGAASNPFGDPFEARVMRLKKKIDAGADFIQTQCIFNMDKFKLFMNMVRDQGLDERVHILAGVIPLKSLPMAKYMAKNVSGVDLPEAILDRIKGVPKKARAEEGIKLAVEQIAELKAIKGVHGIHLMAIEWEEMAPRIVEAAGLLPRPTVNRVNAAD